MLILKILEVKTNKNILSLSIFQSNNTDLFILNYRQRSGRWGGDNYL
jgi:uncharacterized membrane protein